jgi:hypothetical protein
MTRDEHRSQAEALVAEADRLVAMMMSRGTVQSAPMVSALTALAGLHLDLAGPEHVDAEAPKPAPLWVPVSKHRYERDSGVWALEYRSQLVDDDPDAGWWLYGPTCTTGSRMGHDGLALAQQQANYRIDEMVGRAGPHPRLDWRVKTSARDLFSCVIDGDLWWLDRVGGDPGEDPQPCHWRLTSGHDQRAVRLDGAAEDSETAAQLAAERMLKTWYPCLAEPEDEVPF